MSGIEVAGLILGVIPILIQAIDGYKDGARRLGPVFHRRRSVDKLARALIMQQQIMEENIKALLAASGCETLGLEDDPISLLDDEKIKDQVEDYLGARNYCVLIGSLKEINEAVKKTAGIISGLVPTSAHPTDNLLDIIQANKAAGSSNLGVLPRIKLIFSYTALNSLTNELDNKTSTFARFAQVIFSNRPAVRSSSRKAVKLAKGLQKVGLFAANLHLALGQGWTDKCHRKHEAKLFLEDRVDMAVDILKSRNRAMAPMLSFNLIFAAAETQERMLWHESAVQIFHEDADGDGDSGALTPVASIVLPPTVSPPQRDITFVENICRAIEATQGDKRLVTFVLTPKRQFGLIAANEKMWHVHKQCTATSLKSCYDGAQRPPLISPALSLKLRMALALKLASSLLQLAQTSWLQRPWSKEAIYFTNPNETGGGHCGQPARHIKMERPFISLDFDTTSSNKQQQAGPRESLLELGIMLLELCHGTSLEAHHTLVTPVSSYYDRLSLALQWIDDRENPLLELYETAVYFCLHPQAMKQTPIVNWDDEGLTTAICENVIEPLWQISKYWR